MNILELVMNKPIKSLTIRDLQRLYHAGYIEVNEKKSLDDDTFRDILHFLLKFPNKYNIAFPEYEFINYAYGATFVKDDLEAIKINRSLILIGFQKLCRLVSLDDKSCFNDLITRLQRNLG